MLRVKILEPILLLGRDRFAGVDMRIRVSGGGYSSQVYAIRQAIAKSMVAYSQKCECAWRDRAACLRGRGCCYELAAVRPR